MIRILTMCPRDWRAAKGEAWPVYVHEVLRRIAAKGHHVAMVVPGRNALPGNGRKTRDIEFTDGIQIVHLGNSLTYPYLASLLLRRMTASANSSPKFDVTIECVAGRPLALSAKTNTPVVPLVFRIPPKTVASGEPPTPYLAASGEARRQLEHAGVPAQFIVRAPFGVDSELFAPGRSEGRWVAPHTDRVLYRALRTSPLNGVTPLIDCFAKRGGLAHGSTRGLPLVLHNPVDDRERSAIYNRADMAYLAEGCETEALALAAAGVPAVCPATPTGCDYVQHGETGLLFEPGNHRDLASRLAQLWGDPTLRARLGAAAHMRARSLTWDATSSLILATIENLLA